MLRYRFLEISTFALGASIQAAARLLLSPTASGKTLEASAASEAHSLKIVLPDRVAMVGDVVCSTSQRIAESLGGAGPLHLALITGGVVSGLVMLVEQNLHYLVLCCQVCFTANTIQPVLSQVSSNILIFGYTELHGQDKVYESSLCIRSAENKHR